MVGQGNGLGLLQMGKARHKVSRFSSIIARSSFKSPLTGRPAPRSHPWYKASYPELPGRCGCGRCEAAFLPPRCAPSRFPPQRSGYPRTPNSPNGQLPLSKSSKIPVRPFTIASPSSWTKFPALPASSHGQGCPDILIVKFLVKGKGFVKIVHQLILSLGKTSSPQFHVFDHPPDILHTLFPSGVWSRYKPRSR